MTDDDKIQVENKIKLLRNANGLTQKQMAEKINMCENAYARMERGENKDFSLHKLDKIAKAFDINILELLSLGEEKVIYCTVTEHSINTNHNNGSGVLIGTVNGEGEHGVIATTTLQMTVNHQAEIINQLKEENKMLKEMIRLLKETSQNKN
ncbi:MAG: helix-turn-helix transcriptional regulator [Moraxellaceae bacterium]|nr:helix-turn-helix transcriptional regulator [Moraxellaceae bacterium]